MKNIICELKYQEVQPSKNDELAENVTRKGGK